MDLLTLATTLLTIAPLTSRRIYEAIAAGCIPVIIADRLQLPFARRLAWPSFSVRIAEAEALADPLAIVRTVSPPSPPTPSPPTPSPAPPRSVACGRYTDNTDYAYCACCTDCACCTY